MISNFKMWFILNAFFFFLWCLFKFYSPFHCTLCLGERALGEWVWAFPGTTGQWERGRPPPLRACPCWGGAVLCQGALRQRSPAAGSPAPSPLRRELAGEALHPRPGDPRLGLAPPSAGNLTRGGGGGGAQVPAGRASAPATPRLPSRGRRGHAHPQPAAGGASLPTGGWSHFLQTARPSDS